MSPEKVLVDTSAWILSFKKDGNPEMKDFLKNSFPLISEENIIFESTTAFIEGDLFYIPANPPV